MLVQLCLEYRTTILVLVEAPTVQGTERTQNLSFGPSEDATSKAEDGTFIEETRLQ